MNSNAIEKIAVSKLNSPIARCELLRPEISENEKTPSFDGHIELYSKPGNKKSDLLGRCPVQVKGEILPKDDLSKEKISYPADIDDIKNYLKEGGVIYFVVGISETSDNYQIYYRSLLPIDLQNIIDSLNDNQKTKNISLKKFPQSSEQIKLIFWDFLFHRKIQFGTIDFYNEMKLYQSDDNENCTMWIRPTPTLFDALLDDEPKYLYKNFGNKIPIPFQVGTIKTLAIENHAIDVSIDNQIFFRDVILFFKKAGQLKSVTLNQGLSIQVKTNNKSADIKFTEKCTIAHYIENLKFMIALANGRELKIGKFAVGTNPKIGDNVNLLEQRLEFFQNVQKLLERLHITKEIKVREFTVSMYSQFNMLYQIIFENKSFEEKIEGSGFALLNIGTIKILLFRSEKTSTTIEYLNPFEQNKWKFLISRSDSDIKFPSSVFVTLTKNEILSCDNIYYPKLVEDITSVEYSNVYGESVNNLVLELLSAYDTNQNKEILDCAFEIISWLYEQSHDEIYFINKLQTIRRKRPLNPDEINKIWELREVAKTLELRIGYSILLGEKQSCEYLLKKLSSETQKLFSKFPIVNLIDKCAVN